MEGTVTTLALVANAGDGTISTFDVTDGRLERVAVSPTGAGVGTLVIDPVARLVFAGVKAPVPRSPEDDDLGPAVVTMALDAATGELAEVARRAVDASMTYVDLTPDRTRLLGASYGGGFAVGWPIREGVLGAEGNRVELPNLHCVVASSDTHAYLVSLGADAIAGCDVDSDGGLVERTRAAAPDGSGPRHLVLSSANAVAYVITEFSGEVLRFARAEDGALTLTDTTSIVDPEAGLSHSRYLADPMAEHLIWGADLHLSNDESVLWATERNASTIASLALQGGTLGSVTALRATEPQPRGFAVTPDGKHVLVCGERSTTVTLYRVLEDGTLQPVHTEETGQAANWVRFVEV